MDSPKRKVSGRWSNLNNEMNTSSQFRTSINFETPGGTDERNNPWFYSMISSSCYQYFIILISFMYAFLIIIVVIIESKDEYYDYNTVGLTVF